MPQSSYMPLYTASYPILAKVQKPGGVTVLTTVGPGDVPNKPAWTGTQIMTVGTEEHAKSLELKPAEEVVEEESEEEEDE